MPKEVITYGNYERGEPWIQVGWTRGLDVQLGVLVEKDVHPDVVRYADLDREGINKLIRTLRKARDQAFGSDA